MTLLDPPGGLAEGRIDPWRNEIELEAAEVRETLTEARIALSEVIRIGNRARAAREIAAKVGYTNAQRVLFILTDGPDVERERRAMAELVIHAGADEQALAILDRVTK